MGLQTMPCDALHKTRENRDKINAPLRLILLNNIVMPSSLVFPGSYMVLFYDGIKKNIQPINLRPVPLEQRQQVDQQVFFPLSSLPVRLAPSSVTHAFTCPVRSQHDPVMMTQCPRLRGLEG